MSHRFPKPLSVFFLAAACLGAGALTGCGDDDDDNPAAGSGGQGGKSGGAGNKSGQGGSNAAGSAGGLNTAGSAGQGQGGSNAAGSAGQGQGGSAGSAGQAGSAGSDDGGAAGSAPGGSGGQAGDGGQAGAGEQGAAGQGSAGEQGAAGQGGTGEQGAAGQGGINTQGAAGQGGIGVQGAAGQGGVGTQGAAGQGGIGEQGAAGQGGVGTQGAGGQGGFGEQGAAGQGGVGGVAGQGGVGGVGGQGGIGGVGGQGGVGGATPPPSTCTSKVASAMLAQLSAIPEITKVSTGTTSAAGACAFVLEFDQPVDHQNPAGPHFTQRVRLMHRSTAAPTSFSTNGYNIGGGTGIGNDELSSILNGNRVHVEHRFFPPSQPTPPLWEHLTIEQAAADHHRIVQALRPLYTGKWISTGASKGGMTASYHHRFYPGDVDGTVAYVAPLSFSPADPRYTDFLDHVGTQACRDGIVALQREALGPARRANLVARMVQQGAASNSTYNFFGPDKLFEFAVTEVRFVFWQYGNISQCNSLPSPTASDATIFNFLDGVANFAGSYDDAALTFFAPYYYQAAVQLGAPEPTERHLDGLLQYPGQSVPANYPPAGVPKVFDPGSMQDVSNWVKTQGQHFLFVYGQNDPWSAAAYDIGSAPDTYRFFAPNGNHGSDIFDLTPADREVALSALESWTGVTISRTTPPAEERLAWRLERRQGQPPRLP
jgi:PS-10 peptidase S37